MEFSHDRTLCQSLREYGRGIAGGLMFSLPLLFTMEVWWAGFTLHPLRILLYVVFTFALLLIYNRFVGLRKNATWREVAIDSVEEMGIGVLLSATILYLSGRIGPDTLPDEMMGKIIMEAMAVAIGVSVGTAQLGASDDGDSGTGDEEPAGDSEKPSNSYLPQVGVAMCGAVLFAANVAPTDEVTVIATEISAIRLLLLALFSLLLGALILHFAGFRGADLHVARDSVLVKARGLMTTYAVALSVSACLLWFYGVLDGSPFGIIVAQIIVLGVPAVLGASAGRLLLQTAGADN